MRSLVLPIVIFRFVKFKKPVLSETAFASVDVPEPDAPKM